MATTFTIEQLEALTEAISQGALKVKYADREVQYHSLSEMLKLREIMKKELGLTTEKNNKKLAEFSKGFDDGCE